MTYLHDLSTCTYNFGRQEGVLSIGWLDGRHPFPLGETSQGFREKLRQICRHPVKRYFGSHECELCKGCDRPACNGEIRVAGTGVMYASPTLISHYVEAHLPIAEECDASIEADAKALYSVISNNYSSPLAPVDFSRGDPPHRG